MSNSRSTTSTFLNDNAAIILVLSRESASNITDVILGKEYDSLANKQNVCMTSVFCM